MKEIILVSISDFLFFQLQGWSKISAFCKELEIRHWNHLSVLHRGHCKFLCYLWNLCSVFEFLIIFSNLAFLEYLYITQRNYTNTHYVYLRRWLLSNTPMQLKSSIQGTAFCSILWNLLSSFCSIQVENRNNCIWYIKYYFLLGSLQ